MEIVKNIYEAEATYGSIYKTYIDDQINDTLGPSFDAQYLDYMFERIPDFTPHIVIDVGTRSFYSYDYLWSKFAPHISVEGIDLCRDALLSNPRIKEMDAHVMDQYFPNNHYDLVIAFHSLEHMYDMPRVIGNCYKLLQPGGYFCFSLPMPSVNFRKGHWYDVKDNTEMCDICKSVGFKIVYDELIRDLRIRPQQEMFGLCQK